MKSEHAKDRSLSDRLLGAFNRWFCSAAGTWHTFIVTGGLVVIEQMFPHLDPHGFWMLYILTVYSGVTQPALAYSGKQSSDQLAQLLTHAESILEQLQAVNQGANGANDGAQQDHANQKGPEELGAGGGA
jgi:hypothetical protein